MLNTDKELKLYYSISEVARMFDVNESLLRFWEKEFPQLRPKKGGRGIRQYRKEDIETVKLIYHLVKERGMTLEGARKALRKGPAGSGVDRDAELMERLQRIRALLVEVREDLKAGEGEIVADTDAAAEDGTPEAAPVRRRAKAVVKIDESTGGELSDDGQAAAKRTVRKPRRKKEEVEHKELFAFYEQSLF